MSMIRLYIAAIAILMISALAIFLLDSNGTPYREGSWQWVGYRYVEANGIKNAEECSMDPEFQEPQFLEGCRRYFEK